MIITNSSNRDNRRSRVIQDTNDSENNSSPSEGRDGRRDADSNRRRSARHRNYLSRNVLHQPLDLPQGYGEIVIT